MASWEAGGVACCELRSAFKIHSHVAPIGSRKRPAPSPVRGVFAGQGGVWECWSGEYFRFVEAGVGLAGVLVGGGVVG